MSNNDELTKEELFALGALSSQKKPSKMEQRFSPGTVGDSRFHERRPLTAAERLGLVPIDPRNRTVPNRRSGG